MSSTTIDFSDVCVRLPGGVATVVLGRATSHKDIVRVFRDTGEPLLAASMLSKVSLAAVLDGRPENNAWAALTPISMSESQLMEALAGKPVELEEIGGRIHLGTLSVARLFGGDAAAALVERDEGLELVQLRLHQKGREGNKPAADEIVIPAHLISEFLASPDVPGTTGDSCLLTLESGQVRDLLTSGTLRYQAGDRIILVTVRSQIPHEPPSMTRVRHVWSKADRRSRRLSLIDSLFRGDTASAPLENVKDAHFDCARLVVLGQNEPFELLVEAPRLQKGVVGVSLPNPLAKELPSVETILAQSAAIEPALPASLRPGLGDLAEAIAACRGGRTNGTTASIDESAAMPVALAALEIAGQKPQSRDQAAAEKRLEGLGGSLLAGARRLFDRENQTVAKQVMARAAQSGEGPINLEERLKLGRWLAAQVLARDLPDLYALLTTFLAQGEALASDLLVPSVAAIGMRIRCGLSDTRLPELQRCDVEQLVWDSAPLGWRARSGRGGIAAWAEALALLRVDDCGVIATAGQIAELFWNTRDDSPSGVERFNLGAVRALVSHVRSDWGRYAFAILADKSPAEVVEILAPVLWRTCRLAVSSPSQLQLVAGRGREVVIRLGTGVSPDLDRLTMSNLRSRPVEL